ncbi:MAG: hypothetical protein KBA86_02650 [Bacteroidales bacterium]|nr:hypothetical protein [Bacteroidales bacterium]
MFNRIWFYKILLIACLFSNTLPLFAQITDSQKAALDEKNKGFDFYFNCGMYIGNKFTANYYNGISNPSEVSIYRVVDNTYYREEIKNLIEERQDVIMDESGIALDNIETKMRYNMSFIFGFGLIYHFNRNLSLTLSFSQARLTTIGGVTFTYNSGVPGNERPQILVYNVIGKELRNFFEIGTRYTIYANEKVLPFFELAAQLNSLKVKSADLVIEDQPFSMMDIYAGQTYVPNSGLTEINPYLGGVGGGIVGGFGIRIPFTKTVALEPIIQLQYTFMNLKVYDEKKMMPNYNFMVRLIVGDEIFAKK